MVALSLAYVTFLARDVAALAEFYVAGLGLDEVAASRDQRYREVRGGGCMIGFASDTVRPALNLPEVEPVGTRSVLTFDVGSVAAIPGAIERAVNAGAELVREPLDTPFGQRQAALRDPDGNVFRLSAALGT
jgi:catechol 2,3-dioxygenase-like lactoylglutathione lyase family enzyme